VIRGPWLVTRIQPENRRRESGAQFAVAGRRFALRSCRWAASGRLHVRVFRLFAV